MSQPPRTGQPNSFNTLLRSHMVNRHHSRVPYFRPITAVVINDCHCNLGHMISFDGMK